MEVAIKELPSFKPRKPDGIYPLSLQKGWSLLKSFAAAYIFLGRFKI